MKNTKTTKWYFASDFHLGSPDYQSSRIRETKILRWLDSIKHDATDLFLVGDTFDYWLEYKEVVPKYFIRFLGKLAQLSDAGIAIHIFVGNHDVWLFDYFKKEFNATIYYEPIVLENNGKKWYIGHGDGLGPADYGYKFIKKLFHNSVCQALYKWLIHPDIATRVATYLSQTSRQKNGDKDNVFHGVGEEWLVQFCVDYVQNTQHIDYFIFGHRHLCLDITLPSASRYINLGEWFSQCMYASWDGKKFAFKCWEGDTQAIFKTTYDG